MPTTDRRARWVSSADRKQRDRGSPTTALPAGGNGVRRIGVVLQYWQHTWCPRQAVGEKPLWRHEQIPEGEG